MLKAHPWWVFLVTLSACSTGVKGEGNLDGASSESGRGESGLPIERVLLLNQRDQQALEDALSQRVEICMRKRGFDYAAPHSVPSPSDFSLKVRYGAVPTEDPATWGYRDPQLIDQVERREASDDAPSLEATTALLGDPTRPQNDGDSGNCYAVARTEVYGDSRGVAGWPGYQNLVSLQVDSNNELYASRSAERLTSGWSECMRSAGFDFARWWEAPLSFNVDPASPASITDAERRSASVDRSCRASLHFEDSLLRLESAIQDRMLDAIPEVVAEFRTASSAAVRRAGQLLAADSATGPERASATTAN
jgi:hypothetical protein